MPPSLLKQTESYTRGMALSVLFNLFAKGILFLLTVLIAAYFGSGIRTDLYFFIYSSMVLLSGFINAIDTAVLIPESMRLQETEGKKAAMGFLNRFLWIYACIGILFTLLMYFFGIRLFALISRFSESDIHLYKNYFLLGSGFFILMLLTSYINTILASLKFFTVPMIISGINSCLVIAGILLLHRQFDVQSVFLSGIVAYGVNLLFLLFLLKRHAGWDFYARPVSTGKKVRRNILFAELGQLATLASSFLPLYLLSGFGQGVISLMNYGKNIADIPNTLVTAQVTGVSGIELNELVAKKDEQGVNSSFVATGKLLLFLLIPIACFLFVFAEPVVRLFYQRGQFTADSVAGSAIYLRLFSATIFIVGINALVSRVFMATQFIRLAFLYQLVLNSLLILAIWLFTTHYGAVGYPYAMIVIYALNFLLMYFMCKKLPLHIDYASLFSYAGILFLINGAISVSLYFGLPNLAQSDIPQLLIGCFSYLIIGLFLNHWLKLNPLPGQVLQYVRKRFS